MSRNNWPERSPMGPRHGSPAFASKQSKHNTHYFWQSPKLITIIIFFFCSHHTFIMSTWRRPFVFPRRFQGFGGHELPISLQSAARDRHATGRWVRGSRDFASAGGAEVFEDGHLERWDGKKLLEGDVLIYHKFSIIYIYNYMVIYMCAWYMLV